MKKYWMLCCDLQIQLQNDSLPLPGKEYLGILRRKLQGEGNFYGDMYEFTEVASLSTVVRRNVHLFQGQYVTLTRRPDGSPRLNFRNLKIDTDFDIETYCFEVVNEIRQALYSQIED